jgi:hypothetical protein
MPYSDKEEQRRYAKEYQKLRRLRLISEGFCQCGDTLAEGLKYCQRCRDRGKAIRDAKVTAGLCANCKFPTYNKRRYCQKCIDKGFRKRNRVSYTYKTYTEFKKAAYDRLSPVKCAGCGITEIKVLSMDHKNGDGAAKRKLFSEERSTLKLYKKIVCMESDPKEIYQLLCYNCQRFKGIAPQEDFLKIKCKITWGPINMPENYKASSLSELEEDWLETMGAE